MTLRKAECHFLKAECQPTSRTEIRSGLPDTQADTHDTQLFPSVSRRSSLAKASDTHDTHDTHFSVSTLDMFYRLLTSQPASQPPTPHRNTLPSEKVIFKCHECHECQRPTFDHLIKTLNSFDQVSDIASLSPALSCQFDNIRQRSNILSQAVSGLLRCRTLASVRHHTDDQPDRGRALAISGRSWSGCDRSDQRSAGRCHRPRLFSLSLSRIPCKASRPELVWLISLPTRQRYLFVSPACDMVQRLCLGHS